MKAKRPYKVVQGERVALSATEVKHFIMRVHGWSEEEYNRERYKIKNKLRAYEGYTNVPDDRVQSPVNLLYFQAKAMKEMRDKGQEYTPSREMERLQNFPSVGSAKELQKALQSPTRVEKWGRAYEITTYLQFGGLIRDSEKAREIAEAIDDPVKREQALTAYANALQAAKKKALSEAKDGAVPIPVGESFGYGDVDDFDYRQWLD